MVRPLVPFFDRRKDTQCQAFVKSVVTSRLFKIMMISTVSMNAFFMVLWTDYKTRYNLFRLFEVSGQRESIFFCFLCFISENSIRFEGILKDILFKKLHVEKF